MLMAYKSQNWLLLEIQESALKKKKNNKFPGFKSTRASWWLHGKESEDPPARLETQVISLDQEDPLEEEMAICSSNLAWEIPWTEETGWLQSTRSQKS